MFRKLVSNIAFSPALVGQLGFYAKRLRKEEATRRIGLVFTALALIVQSFAVFTPPEAANAASPSNLIPGGVRSHAEYVRHYDQNTNNIKDLFTAVGITRENLTSAQAGKVNSKDGVYSWGMTPHFTHAQGERPYTVRTANGGTRTFYYRPLYLWDTKSYTIKNGSTYDAYIGTASNGMWFALLNICGNLVLKVNPPVPKCPEGTIGTYPNCATPPKMCTVPGKEHLRADDPNCKAPEPCPQNPKLTKNDPECQPCPGDNTLWIKDDKCVASVVYSKTASNSTQGVDATKTTAKAGDKIVYTLNIRNSGNAEASVTPTENLLDITEYAKVIELGGGTYNSETKTLSWPSFKLAPGSTQTRMFTVQIADTIPAMGTGVSDKTSYDCRIDNAFGNMISINVDCPVQKQIIEQTVSELPHTGPRENMIFAGVLLAIVAYFYARARQVKKEVRLIRRDLNAGTI